MLMLSFRFCDMWYVIFLSVSESMQVYYRLFICVLSFENKLLTWRGLGSH